MKKFKAGNIISHIYLIILTFISIFPLVWIIISSLKGKGELTGNPTAFWPRHGLLTIMPMLSMTLSFS